MEAGGELSYVLKSQGHGGNAHGQGEIQGVTPTQFINAKQDLNLFCLPSTSARCWFRKDGAAVR